MESASALSDSEHLSTTYRAYTLSRWPPVLHGYGFGILHFPLSPAFHTICLHLFTSLFGMYDKLFPPLMSIVIET